MTDSGRTIRKTVFGLALAAVAVAGFSACSSTTKTQAPGAPGGQAPATTTAPTSPPTTTAPSSGGASF
jgi:hypothetical protein